MVLFASLGCPVEAPALELVPFCPQVSRTKLPFAILCSSPFLLPFLSSLLPDMCKLGWAQVEEPFKQLIKTIKSWKLTLGNDCAIVLLDFLRKKKLESLAVLLLISRGSPYKLLNLELENYWASTWKKKNLKSCQSPESFSSSFSQSPWRSKRPGL